MFFYSRSLEPAAASGAAPGVPTGANGRKARTGKNGRSGRSGRSRRSGKAGKQDKKGRRLFRLFCRPLLCAPAPLLPPPVPLLLLSCGTPPVSSRIACRAVIRLHGAPGRRASPGHRGAPRCTGMYQGAPGSSRKQLEAAGNIGNRCKTREAAGRHPRHRKPPGNLGVGNPPQADGIRDRPRRGTLRTSRPRRLPPASPSRPRRCPLPLHALRHAAEEAQSGLSLPPAPCGGSSLPRKGRPNEFSAPAHRIA